jgi:hypothetical protein
LDTFDACRHLSVDDEPTLSVSMDINGDFTCILLLIDVNPDDLQAGVPTYVN